MMTKPVIPITEEIYVKIMLELVREDLKTETINTLEGKIEDLNSHSTWVT